MRVQAMRRYCALLICRDGAVSLIKVLEGGKAPAERNLGHNTDSRTHASGLQTWVDDRLAFDARDETNPLMDSAVA